MNFETLKLDIAGPVATISLDRPDAANSLNLQMGNDLLAAANHCASDSSIRAVILTAEGRMFCAGGDVGGFAKAENAGELLRAITTGLHAAVARLQRMDPPLIVAVNGVAAGAGMSLALTGDFVIAAASAKFTMAYTAIGLSPDGSSTFFLPRLVGPQKAKQLMIDNDVLGADEALALGIVSDVVPDEELMSTANELAEKLAAGPTKAYGELRRLVADSFNTSLEAQMERETRAIADLANHTDDARNGIAAFIAKEKADFRGK